LIENKGEREKYKISNTVHLSWIESTSIVGRITWLKKKRKFLALFSSFSFCVFFPSTTKVLTHYYFLPFFVKIRVKTSSLRPFLLRNWMNDICSSSDDDGGSGGGAHVSQLFFFLFSSLLFFDYMSRWYKVLLLWAWWWSSMPRHLPMD
jgi:hypothetical protein